MENSNFIMLPEDILAVIDGLADSGTSRSEFVETLLRKYLMPKGSAYRDAGERTGSTKRLSFLRKQESVFYDFTDPRTVDSCFRRNDSRGTKKENNHGL